MVYTPVVWFVRLLLEVKCVNIKRGYGTLQLMISQKSTIHHTLLYKAYNQGPEHNSEKSAIYKHHFSILCCYPKVLISIQIKITKII